MTYALPSQISTEKDKQGYKPLLIIEIPGIDQYWASRYIRIDALGTTPAPDNADDYTNWSDGSGADYADVLQGVSGIDNSIDRDGGLASVGQLTIDVVNIADPSFTEFLNANKHIEGKSVDVYLAFDDGTGLNRNEIVNIFTGKIDSWRADYDTFSIDVTHENLFLQKELGVIIASDEYTYEADTTTDNQEKFAVLDSAIGQVKPLVYGKHEMHLQDTDVSTVNLSGHVDMIPAIRVRNRRHYGFTDIYTYDYLVAGHELETLSNSNIWLRHKSTGRMFLLDSQHVDISNVDSAGNAIVSIQTSGSPTNNIAITEFVFGSGIENANSATLAIDWADPSNGYDRDIDSAMTIDTEFTTWNNHDVNITFDAYEQNTNTVIDAVTVYARSSINGNTGDVTFTINNDDRIGKSASTLDSAGTMPSSATGIETEVAVGLTDASNNDPAIQASVYAVYKRVDLHIDVGAGGNFDPTDWELFAACAGKPDDGSGTITGTANQLLENPVHIIEDIITNELNITAVDSTAFDTAATSRSSWTFAFALTEIEDVITLLDDLAKKSNVYLFWNHENKLASSAYQSSLSSTGDVFDSSPASSGGSFTEHPIVRDSWQTRQSSKSELVNSVRVWYGYDYVQNDYPDYSEDTNSTSISRYGETVHQTIEHSYTNDLATANLLISNLLYIFGFRYQISEWDSFLNAINFEISDGIYLHTDIIEDVNGASNMSTDVWQIISILPKLLDGAGGVNLRAWRRHNG